MSVSAINRPTVAPTRPAAWLAWPIAAALAVGVGIAATNKVYAVGVVALVLLVWGVMQTLRRPVLGFYFCLAFYPFYTFLRGLVLLTKVPAPLSVVSLWPEAVLVVMGTSVLIGCIKSGRRVHVTGNDLPVGLLAASGVYAFVLSVVQKEPVAGAYGFHATVMPLFFYTIARWLGLTERQMGKVIAVWLFWFGALALLSLADYVLRPKLTIEMSILLRDGFWGNWDPHIFFKWYPRMQSLMFAEQFFGTICGMAAVYCLSRFSAHPLRFWVLPLLGLSALCLGLTMSRGAIVNAAIAVSVLFVFFRGRHRALLVTVLAVAIAAVAVVMMISTGPKTAQEKKRDDRIATLIKRVSALSDTSNTNAYDRVTQWQYAVSYFPLYPAGRGLGRAGAQALFHGTGDGSVAIADGGYFKIMAESGLPGLLLFGAGGLGFVLVLTRLLYFYRDRPNTPNLVLGRALVCILCGLLVHNLAANIFDAYYIQPVFWMLSGLFVTEAERHIAEQQTAVRTLAIVPVEP